MANTKSEKTQNVVEMGGNLNNVFEKIAKARDKIISLKNKRAQLNAEIKAEREAMEALIGSKKAYDLALSYFEASPEQREGFDQAYIVAREGMGLPVKGAQIDLFEKKEKMNAAA